MATKKRVPRATAAPRARTVGAGEFKATCLELMDEVNERHVEVVITKRGAPVAKLAPVDTTPPSPFGFLRGTVLAEVELVGPEHDAWEESDTDPLNDDR
jgi:prevent-host-death family protein